MYIFLLCILFYMHTENVIHWNIMIDEGRGWGKGLLGTKALQGLNSSFPVPKGRLSTVRLSTEVCDKRTRENEMPTLHKEKNPHSDTNRGLEQGAQRGWVISVLGGLSGWMKTWAAGSDHRVDSALSRRLD